MIQLVLSDNIYPSIGVKGSNNPSEFVFPSARRLITLLGFTSGDTVNVSFKLPKVPHYTLSVSYDSPNDLVTLDTRDFGGGNFCGSKFASLLNISERQLKHLKNIYVVVKEYNDAILYSHKSSCIYSMNERFALTSSARDFLRTFIRKDIILEISTVKPPKFWLSSWKRAKVVNMDESYVSLRRFFKVGEFCIYDTKALLNVTEYQLSKLKYIYYKTKSI